MPFCPKCKSEYREGFDTCSDCNVDLVAELTDVPADGELVVVGTFLAAGEAEMGKIKLGSQGIDSVVMGSITSECVPMFGIAEVRLMTRAEDADRANKILSED